MPAKVSDLTPLIFRDRCPTPATIKSTQMKQMMKISKRMTKKCDSEESAQHLCAHSLKGFIGLTELVTGSLLVWFSAWTCTKTVQLLKFHEENFM